MTAKFTRRADNSGWLTVRLSGTGQLAALCEYVQVDVMRDAGGRTYFKIVDGCVAVGEEASLTSANAARYLSPTGPSGPASLVVTYVGTPVEEVSRFKGRLTQQWAGLSFNGQTARVTLNSVWGGAYAPLSPGAHTILAPDYSHATISTAGYAAATAGMFGSPLLWAVPCKTAAATFT